MEEALKKFEKNQSPDQQGLTGLGFVNQDKYGNKESRTPHSACGILLLCPHGHFQFLLLLHPPFPIALAD